MREVDSHDSHASVHHVGKHGQVLTGGADGGHNLGQRKSLVESLGIALQSHDLAETRGHSTSGKVKSVGTEHGGWLWCFAKYDRSIRKVQCNSGSTVLKCFDADRPRLEHTTYVILILLK